MKNRTRLVAAILLLTAVGILFAISFAAPGRFGDVTEEHWAYSMINEMADGGLIKGYEDGSFRPSNQITIAEMCSLIAHAKGEGGNTEGYWAAGMIEYCIYDLHCLPIQGPTTQDYYGVPCSRELAVHMLMTGLGINEENATLKPKTVYRSDIPDYDEINDLYKDEVYNAYCKGVLTGYEDGSFKPQGSLTRAEVATIFYRTGWKTALPKIEDDSIYYGGAPITDDWYSVLDTPIKLIDNDTLCKALGRQWIYEVNKYRVEQSGGDTSLILKWNADLEQYAHELRDIYMKDPGPGKITISEELKILHYEDKMIPAGIKPCDSYLSRMDPSKFHVSQEMSPRWIVQALISGAFNYDNAVINLKNDKDAAQQIGVWGWCYDDHGSYSFHVVTTCPADANGRYDKYLK